MAELVKRRARRRPYGRTPDHLAYDGSAVRQLGRDELVQPRPLVRHKQRAVARPKARVREAGEVSVFAVAGFLAVGVCAVLLLMGYVQLATISNDVVELRSQMTTLQAEEAKLRAQYELAYDLKTIEESVTGSGRMVKPQSDQVFYVDLSEPDRVVCFQEEAPVKGLEGVVESGKDVWSKVVEYFK